VGLATAGGLAGPIEAEAADARAPLLYINPLNNKKRAIDVLYQSNFDKLGGR
jgi:hypothetical protein